MPKDSYEVHSVSLKEADNFEVLVLTLPEDEINDKLTYLTREKGKISHSFYEDFVISNCVGNINQLLSYINQNLGNQPNLLKIRAELMNAILKHNSQLAPENLIINKNYVVKIKKFKKLKDGEKSIIENSNWDISYYEDVDDTKSLSNLAKDKEKDIKNLKNKVKDKIKDIDELEHDVKQVWWKRIGQYIDIKKFKKDDSIHILKKRYFHSPTSFNTFIVSVCVIGFEDLFMLLDNMGIPSRVAPPILMNELYELCRSLNKFLTYNNAQEVSDDSKNTSDSGKGKKPQKTTTAGLMHKYGDTKSKIKFKDVPKEDLLKLGDNMKVSLIGQDPAVDILVDTIQRAKIGLKDPVKPIGSFLFAGRTGVGKTLATKILADELIKSRDNLITIDCSEYSADHEYSKLIGCFVPGSKVLMGDGSLKNIENIDPGDEVISHTGNKRRVRYLHEYNQEGEMIELLMANTNVPIVTTKTHEILAIKHNNCDKGEERAYRVCKPTCKQEYCVDPPHEKYKLNWLPASELEEGDVVVYPRYKSTGKYPNRIDLVDYIEDADNYKYDDKYVWAQKQVKVPRYVEINEDFTRLAGYYVSEGGSAGSGKTINFTFNSKEHFYITEVVRLVRCVFGNEVKIRLEDRSKNSSHRIWVSSKIACKLMCDLFGYNTYVKKTPEWFKDMPDNLVKGFLETAVFGDGCATVPRRIDYSTVSPSLFSQMELLFRRLGYITYKNVEIPKNTKWFPRYRLYISGNQIIKLNDEFNFDLDLKDMGHTNIQRKAWIDDNYVYFQLKGANTVSYSGNVYDLDIEKDSSYVIEFIVHNSPAGYIGHEQGGNLTNAITKNPFSVIVFDEVEKASSKVHELMLQILEEGRLTDGQGQQASFKDAIIIMTSNVGSTEIDAIEKTIGFGDVGKITDNKKDTALTEALKKKFKPEFLNRIDSIVNFKTLIKKDYMRIIDIELYKLETNLKNNDTDYKELSLEFDKTVKNFVYKHGIDEKYGARPLKRCIEREIATPLSKKILKEDIVGDSVILMAVKRDKLTFEVSEKVEETPFYMSDGYQVINGV